MRRRLRSLVTGVDEKEKRSRDGDNCLHRSTWRKYDNDPWFEETRKFRCNEYYAFIYAELTNLNRKIYVTGQIEFLINDINEASSYKMKQVNSTNTFSSYATTMLEPAYSYVILSNVLSRSITSMSTNCLKPRMFFNDIWKRNLAFYLMPRATTCTYVDARIFPSWLRIAYSQVPSVSKRP